MPLDHTKLHTYNRAELFTELERLTILNHNLEATIAGTTDSPVLEGELKLYRQIQVLKLAKVRKWIVRTGRV